MLLTNKKYQEPSAVLTSLVDDFGNQLILGDQKDVAEFNLNFLERIEEGLGERLRVKEEFKSLNGSGGSGAGSTPDPQDIVRKSSILDESHSETPDPGPPVQPNTIQELFFGKQKIILKVQDSTRTKTFSEQIEKMGPVYIDVGGEKELMEAW